MDDFATGYLAVALREEGVDRNLHDKDAAPGKLVVALREEGVDRNSSWASNITSFAMSPSARRAWIEMVCAAARGGSMQSRPPRGGRG